MRGFAEQNYINPATVPNKTSLFSLTVSFHTRRFSPGIFPKAFCCRCIYAFSAYKALFLYVLNDFSDPDVFSDLKLLITPFFKSPSVMKVIKNRFIPFKIGDLMAINLFGVVFLRREYTMRPDELNHEAIHTAQMRELGYVPFYMLYVAEWLVRLFMKGNAYMNLTFEREAYGHQRDLGYLAHRKHFAQWRKG